MMFDEEDFLEDNSFVNKDIDDSRFSYKSDVREYHDDKELYQG